MKIRDTFLPYSKQMIDDDDIEAVTKALRSDWIAGGGPLCNEFDDAFADYVGTACAVSCCNGTAALHLALLASGIRPGDEVIVPAMTFAATANAVVMCGAVPIFCDVNRDDLLINVELAEEYITPKTRAIIAVDYAGLPCDYEALWDLTANCNIALIADACHSLGGGYQGDNVGTLATLNCFSLHAVKAMTTGEGGMVTTHDWRLASTMLSYRSHANAGAGNQTMLGYNYRLTAIQAALGLSQLKKVDGFVEKRRSIARLYNDRIEGAWPIPKTDGINREHAYHLYVVKLPKYDIAEKVKNALYDYNIGTQRHYKPVNTHPYYLMNFGRQDCPVAENAYRNILSLPCHPGMTEDGVDYVVEALKEVCGAS
jgi:perosamine synthetase